MALHGPIKVNNQTIGNWQARRLTLGPDPDGTAEYEWYVQMHGDSPPRVYSGHTRHRVDDGALALMLTVLNRAEVERRRAASS